MSLTLARLAATGPLAPTSSPGERRSAGCDGSAPAVAPGSTVRRELTSSRLSRTYRLHAGRAIAPGEPAPLVLNFHGRGGSGAAVEEYSGLLPISDRAGFYLVSPDGEGSPAGWSAGASLPGWPVDDVAFVHDLLEQLRRDLCLDTTRVYATGHSNGAFMAARLACALPGEVAGVALVAGIHVPAEGCAAAVPVLAIHGTDDDVVPFAGGLVRGTYAYHGTQAEFAAWARINRCGSTPTFERVSPHVMVEQEQACSAPLELVLVDGAGHGWPGVQGTPLAAEIQSAELIWAFFEGQRLAG